MTHEEIIKLARKAGIAKHGLGWTCWEGQLERFAALVAAAEREACVQIIEEYRISGGNSVAGELAREWTYNALKEIRDDIRARI
jgi:hypothetical protein